jgi:hypothetical protein
MKTNNNIFVLFVIIGAVSFNSALAQRPDGSESATSKGFSVNHAVQVANRYLVTYMSSDTSSPNRSATVVTVTNQSNKSCDVKVTWFKGFTPDTPVCTTTTKVASGVTHDFCSRSLPQDITACNSICDPELTFDEGKAIVSSSKSNDCDDIGVESRVYYTTGGADTEVAAVSNPKIVRVRESEDCVQNVSDVGE